MTDQRLTLHVPDPVVPTSLNLGAPWNGTPPDAGTAWNGAGLTVNSAGRVWLDANGDAASSTFAALSNAELGSDSNPGAGLLFQSLTNSVYCLSQEANITNSNGSVLIAGGGGVKIVAGHGAPLTFGLGDDSLKNVDPSDTNPDSAHAQAYIDHLDEVANGWTITDTTMAGALTALDLGLKIAEVCQGEGMGTLADKLFLLGSAANIAGGTVNLLGMHGEDLPGLNIHAVSNVNLITTGFCSIHALPGLLLSGACVSGLGFATAGVTGFLGATLNCIAFTTVEGKQVSLTATKDLSLGAKVKKLVMYAPTFTIGTKTPTSFALTQSPALNVRARALKSLEVAAPTAPMFGQIGVDALGTAVYEGGELDVDAGTTITLKGPTYEVKVALDGISIEVAKTTKVGLTASKATLEVPGGQKLQLDSKGVFVGSSSTKIEIAPSGTVTWTAPLVNFL